MSHKTAGGGPRRHNERPWREVLLAFLSSVLLVLTPFGHIDVIERYGRGSFNRWFAPLLYGEGQRKWTTVVLVQDKDLADLGVAWPAPYAEHARLLAAIRELQPRALMIDFLFVDPRPDPTLDELIRELAAYRAERIPVLLARPPRRAPDPDVRAELRPPLTRLTPVPRIVGEDSRYPLVFPQCDPATERAVSCRETPRFTPAAAIYVELCNGATAPPDFSLCRPPVLELGRQAEEGGRGDAALEVFWGATPEREGLRDTTCNEVPQGLWAWVPQGLWAWITTVRKYGAEPLRLDCLFTPTVSPGRLLGFRSDDDAKALEKLIKGRAVFYGASLLGLSDVIHPPGHAPLAGVYAHAMALDNLLYFGAKYKREATHVLGLAVTPRRFQLVVLFILQVPLLFGFLHVQARRLNRSGLTGAAAAVVQMGFAGAYALFATLVVLALIIFVEFSWLDLAPGNWLEAVTAAVATKHLGVNVVPILMRLPGVRRLQAG